MPNEENAAESSLAKKVFTWQAYPWLLFLALSVINAMIYPSIFGFMGKLWWILGPILTIQIWLLAVITFIQKFKNGGKYVDTLARGRRIGFFSLFVIYAVSCIDNLYRILILKQWKYYKRWEPLQPDQSIWFGVAYNMLGALICGALIIWAAHELWRSRRAK